MYVHAPVLSRWHCVKLRPWARESEQARSSVPIACLTRFNDSLEFRRSKQRSSGGVCVRGGWECDLPCTPARPQQAFTPFRSRHSTFKLRPRIRVEPFAASRERHVHRPRRRS